MIELGDFVWWHPNESDAPVIECAHSSMLDAYDEGKVQLKIATARCAFEYSGHPFPQGTKLVHEYEKDKHFWGFVGRHENGEFKEGKWHKTQLLTGHGIDARLAHFIDMSRLPMRECVWQLPKEVRDELDERGVLGE